MRDWPTRFLLLWLYLCALPGYATSRCLSVCKTHTCTRGPAHVRAQHTSFSRLVYERLLGPTVMKLGHSGCTCEFPSRLTVVLALRTFVSAHSALVHITPRHTFAYLAFPVAFPSIIKCTCMYGVFRVNCDFTDTITEIPRYRSSFIHVFIKTFKYSKSNTEEHTYEICIGRTWIDVIIIIPLHM